MILVSLLAACGTAEGEPTATATAMVTATVTATATTTATATPLRVLSPWRQEPTAITPTFAAPQPTASPTRTRPATVTPTFGPTATPHTPPRPPLGELFLTLPPGVPLPTAADCAARVRRHPWEPRPDNAAGNHTRPARLALPPWGGVAPRANTELLPRIDGDFAGTTDEILQWAACKWGLDEDIARAMAVQESNWHQGARADLAHNPERCVAGDSPPCPTSFGLLQIKWTAFPGTYPNSAQSTAFNADYAFAVLRACYEGHERWLNDVERGRDYAAGDLWGCLGRWYAGRWHTAAADAYITQVQRRLATRDWLAPDFPWR